MRFFLRLAPTRKDYLFVYVDVAAEGTHSCARDSVHAQGSERGVQQASLESKSVLPAIVHPYVQQWAAEEVRLARCGPLKFLLHNGGAL